MSYNGWLRFGLLGDWDALFDLDLLAEDLCASIEELVAATGAGAAGGTSGNGRVTSASGNGRAAAPSARQRKRTSRTR